MSNIKKYILLSVIIFIILILAYLILININNTDNINNVSVAGQDMQVVRTYKNPIVPMGFKRVETENANWQQDENGYPKGWNDGLVIEDEKGNQFVWIPCTIDKSVNNIVLYSRYILEKNEFVPKSDEQLREIYEKAISQWYFIENDSVNDDILNSIKKYQGFYIGRYETGIEDGTLVSKETLQSLDEYTGWENGKAVIKKDADVWNYITRDKAKKIADNFVDNYTVKSSLITSFCWDVTVKWIDNTIPGFALNSEKFGNYDGIEDKNTYITRKTGESENYRIKNIYDIAGNVSEYTTEISKDTSYSGDKNKIYSVLRGMTKYRIDEVSLANCSGRTPIYSNAAGPLWGFRFILYIK